MGQPIKLQQNLLEAMLFEDDVALETLPRPGKRTLPAIEPSCRSLLAFAQTKLAIDRSLELGVASDKKDRWDPTSMEAMNRLGPSESLEPVWYEL